MCDVQFFIVTPGASTEGFCVGFADACIHAGVSFSSLIPVCSHVMPVWGWVAGWLGKYIFLKPLAEIMTRQVFI